MPVETVCAELCFWSKIMFVGNAMANITLLNNLLDMELERDLCISNEIYIAIRILCTALDIYVILYGYVPKSYGMPKQSIFQSIKIIMVFLRPYCLKKIGN